MSRLFFARQTKIQLGAEETFAWFERKGAIERLIPPWEKVEILEHSSEVKNGSKARLYCKIFGPLGFHWELEHQDYIAGRQFVDTQIRGPFSFYRHRHLVEGDNSSCILKDEIEYSLPFSPISDLFAGVLIDRRFDRMFRYRHITLDNDLISHKDFLDRPRLSYLISGATGLIGKSLCAYLTSAGHLVTRIVRSAKDKGPGDILISKDGKILLDPLKTYDCVINLGGAGIADSRWSEKRKVLLKESRILHTQNLVQALGTLHSPPKCMISASGVGFYGNCANYPDESGEKGKGFLSLLSYEWEEAANRAEELGIRVVNLRLASVISSAGGVLSKLLAPFFLGLGAKIGSGQQHFSWVSLSDVLKAIEFISYTERIAGAVNMSAPSRINNLQFTKALGAAINRPTFLCLPSSVIKLFLGEMGEELLLHSSSAHPKALLDAGFNFLYQDPELAIKDCLGIKSKNG